MKFYKAPRGFRKLDNEPNAIIEDGATVYLNPMYVGEDESPKKIVVMETSGGTFLLADNKRMYSNGEGYLYSRCSIAYFKNPQ